jgi:hypothetical protein
MSDRARGSCILPYVRTDSKISCLTEQGALVSFPMSRQTLNFRPKSYLKKTGQWNLKLDTCCHLVLRLSSLWAVCPVPTRLRVISLFKTREPVCEFCPLTPLWSGRCASDNPWCVRSALGGVLCDSDCWLLVLLTHSSPSQETQFVKRP